MAFCIIHENQIVAGPLELPESYNGINNFNNLSLDMLFQYGWYPVISKNDAYNPLYQIRTGPEKIISNGLVIFEYFIEEKSIDDVKQKVIELLAAKRYEIETGGIVIGETKILTDRESQAQITGAYNAAKNGLVTSLNFKGRPSWGTLSAAEMIAIGEAVYAHVQNCFNVEKAHYDAIMALSTAQEVAEYDINSLWS